MKKIDTFQTFARGAKSLVAILLVMLMAVGNLIAQTISSPYTHEITSKVWSNLGTQILSEVEWTVAGTDGEYYGYDATKGQQFGSKNNPFTTLTITTDDIPGTISSITVNTSGGSGFAATLKVKVGNTYFTYSGEETASLTTTATAYTFTGSSEGEISIEWEQTTPKALYWKSVTIVFEESTTPVVLEPTWVSCNQVNIFNTQVVGLVPTCSTVGDSTVYHFAYTDDFNGYPTQNL